MSSSFVPNQDEAVQYYLALSEPALHLNPLIGHKLSIKYLHQINCIKCGGRTKKSFHQGYCYPCFQTAPETDPAIIRPELDQSHLGISRDMEWAKKNSLTEHTVYLAVSSGLKVGVTRSTNLPYRWIDQGASRGIRLATTPNRYLAGRIEVALKEHYADRTNWRRMLTNHIELDVDLVADKKTALGYLPDDLSQYASVNNKILALHYPVSEYPEKVKSLSLDKQEQVSGILTGIKGQYLYLDGGNVFNVRKHNGYAVELRLA